MEGQAAEVAHVEMPQLHMGGVRRLTSLLRDRSYTGLENLAAWALLAAFSGVAEAEVQEPMAHLRGHL
jgi:hypothetical protein